jgi:GNAT superfamily N-acetyltransferase
MRWTKGEFSVVDDLSAIDVDAVHSFLSQSYWAKGRSRMVVELAMERSLSFGLLHGDETVGFARVITDFAVMGTVEDVFVLPEYQGRGLGMWLMECVLSHPALQGVDIIAATRKAGGFYQRLGFAPLRDREQYMMRPAGTAKATKPPKPGRGADPSRPGKPGKPPKPAKD